MKKARITDMLPKNTAGRPGTKLTPKFITIHNTGIKGATARNGANFYKRQAPTSYCSVHFFVDDKQIIQMLPLNEISWHAGDGAKGRGNNESISIEICEVPNQEKANKNASDLCKELLKQFPLIPIVPHKYWIKKECPRLLLKDDGWNKFLESVYK